MEIWEARITPSVAVSSSFYRTHRQEAGMDKVLFDVMAKRFTWNFSLLNTLIHHS